MADRVLLRSSTALNAPPGFMRTGELAMDPAGSLFVGVGNVGIPLVTQPPDSVALAGTPYATTATPGDVSGRIATTAFVAIALGALGVPAGASAVPAMDGVAAVGISGNFARGDHVHPTDASLAPRANPTFTGQVTVPTAGFGSKDGTAASTLFVQQALAAGGGGTGSGSVSPAGPASAPIAGVYQIDSFAGAQVNTTGSMSVYDDAAATAMWTQILADAAKCTNVGAGYTAKIVFGPHQYNWQNPVNFVVPGNGSTSNPKSSLPVELHLIVEWNSSVHYTFGSAGFCFSPYTMDGRYDDLFSRKQFNNRYQGVSAYAIKKTATAGVSAAANGALGSTHEIAGGGVSNFRFGQFDCYDANTGGYYLSWLDVGGIFFAQIEGPAGSSSPSPLVPTTTTGVNNAGTSAIRLSGFNIQVWLKNLLPNYVECGFRIVGYVEALLTQNLGGVNVDYNVWTDVQGTDWTGFYPNTYGFGLQWTFDDQSEMDSYRWNYDISTVNIILFYGGTIYQHAAGGGLACDGHITGDTANTGGVILRGCTEMKVHDVHFRGPAVNPGVPGDGSGAYCANGGRGLCITSSTFNVAQTKPNAPPTGAYARGTHGTFDGNDFLGWGASGTVSPILFDNDCIALTSSMTRFFFAPSNVHDGYAARYPVEDRYGYNQGFDFVGVADGAFATTLRSLR